jgi:hypothetical protein
MARRRLEQLPEPRERLTLPTIMNSALAARYGVAYVRLAAFAIDVDRAYTELQDEARLPFGWEVFLTQAYLLAAVDPAAAEAHALLEETCLSILEQPPDEQGYGSQLLFAVHDAIERGLYPDTLAAPFRSWRSRPKQLHRALAALRADAGAQLPALARELLAVPLDPPLAPPSQKALEQMRDGGWPAPAAAT